ncbi:MAG TPA: glycosyltransferase family 4 protein [Falsiroseomonas sp.]|jgi:hypothetical protein|nr:glycosyltransferase family 4 protein [Falsiroseomonas sp.]
MPPPIPVLFTHFGDEWLRGSEYVLLDLLRHLDRDRIAPVVWCNGAPLEQACRDAGYPTYRSPLSFYFDAGSPRFSMRHYAAMVREAVVLIRRHDIRVIHANSAAPTQWLVPAAAWTRRPLLTHLHIRYLRRSRFVLLLHQADLVVGVTAHVTQALLADGMPAARLRTIHNGIDPARLTVTRDLRASLDLGEDAVLIGSVGSLIHRKGYDLLLRALAAVQGDFPSLHLAVAGSGEEAEALARLAEELGIRARVHFLGDMATPGDLYAAADFCALATRGESFGLALVEAAWFRRPTVATEVGGVPDVIRNGETGLLVPTEDVAALATALRRLTVDAALRHHLGEAARQDAVRRFLARHMAEQFTRSYEGLAAAGRGASLGLSRLNCYARIGKARGQAG